MHSSDLDDIFDEWDEGVEQSAGVEVVFALDVSVSMLNYDESGSWASQLHGDGGYQKIAKGFHKDATPISDACLSLWVLKRSIEKLDGIASVIGYGSTTKTVTPRNMKAKHNVAVFPQSLEGSTRPWESFEIASWVLSQSPQPNKIFVMLTDGNWYGDESGIKKAVAGLERMRDVTKIYIGIGSGGSANNQNWQEQFDVVANINSATEVTTVVKKAVSVIIRSARKNR
jgi:hypothetical protein